MLFAALTAVFAVAFLSTPQKNSSWLTFLLILLPALGSVFLLSHHYGLAIVAAAQGSLTVLAVMALSTAVYSVFVLVVLRAIPALKWLAAAIIGSISAFASVNAMGLGALQNMPDNQTLFDAIVLASGAIIVIVISVMIRRQQVS
jgi:hypothetical protein